MADIDLIGLTVYILERVPIERLFVKKDPDKEIERLERLVRENPQLALQSLRPVNHPVAQSISQEIPRQTTLPHNRSLVGLPTTAETVAELRRRLGKELYSMEMDLRNGSRINDKPCDCLWGKHALGLEAMAEELMSMDPRPVYKLIIDWLKQHEPVFRVEAIAQHPSEFYQAIVPEARAFRKEVMGTERLGAILTPEQREAAIAKIQEAMKKEMEVPQ